MPFVVVGRLANSPDRPGHSEGFRDWPSTGRRPAANTITYRPGMNGLTAVEKPHPRRGSAKDGRTPDLIQAHFRGKTKEIRLDSRHCGRMPISTKGVVRPLPNPPRHATLGPPP
jgi:hypothetical protein